MWKGEWIVLSISIFADSIRVIKGSITKQELNIKNAKFYPLKKGDIVQGKLKNKDNFKKIILEIKSDFKLSKSNEIYLAVPNGLTFSIETTPI